MKPTQNSTDIINWEAMAIRTKEEDAIIKQVMEKAWKKN